jgi:holin-like protein
MTRGFAVLLLCQLAGEAITRGLGLPVPGPVLGLAFLVAGLAVRKRFYPLEDPMPATSDVGRVADGLLGALALLFVPAGVGVVQYFGLIGAYGLALGLALVGSTLATLLATVGTFLLVKRVVEARQ